MLGAAARHQLYPTQGPFSSNGPIAAFAKRFSMHSLEQLHSITQTMLKSYKQRAATTTFRVSRGRSRIHSGRLAGRDERARKNDPCPPTGYGALVLVGKGLAAHRLPFIAASAMAVFRESKTLKFPRQRPDVPFAGNLINPSIPAFCGP